MARAKGLGLEWRARPPFCVRGVLRRLCRTSVLYWQSKCPICWSWPELCQPLCVQQVFMDLYLHPTCKSSFRKDRPDLKGDVSTWTDLKILRPRAKQRKHKPAPAVIYLIHYDQPQWKKLQYNKNNKNNNNDNNKSYKNTCKFTEMQIICHHDMTKTILR